MSSPTEMGFQMEIYNLDASIGLKKIQEVTYFFKNKLIYLGKYFQLHIYEWNAVPDFPVCQISGPRR
jgi:hypothetical protein